MVSPHNPLSSSPTLKTKKKKEREKRKKGMRGEGSYGKGEGGKEGESDGELRPAADPPPNSPPSRRHVTTQPPWHRCLLPPNLFRRRTDYRVLLHAVTEEDQNPGRGPREERSASQFPEARVAVEPR